MKWQTHGIPPWINSYSPPPPEKAGLPWTTPKTVVLDLGSGFVSVLSHSRSLLSSLFSLPSSI